MKDFNHPLVSIIVITYNSSDFVLETLESVKNQTYRNIELIVSDDSSTDNTPEICEEWIRDNKGQFVRAEVVTTTINQGIPANCNKGIRNAQGEWIRIIAGDDTLVPESIEKYINYINQHNKPDIEALHSNAQRYRGTFSEENRIPFRPLANLKINQSSITAEEQFQSLLRTNRILAGSLFIKKTVFDRIGLYDEEPRLWEDRPMLLKMTKNGIKLHYVDFCSFNYRRHSSSIQSINKSGKFLPDYVVGRHSYYYKNYLQYLPFFERIVAKILLKRVIWFDKFNMNKLKFRIFFRILGFPWSFISNQYKKKY